MFAEIIWDQNTIGVVGVFALPALVIIGGLWYKIEHVKSDNELKRSMVERGMSVEEIERVIAAKSPKR